MTRKSLIDFMVSEARAEDAREGGKFDKEGFGNFFPEHSSDAAEHGIEWDDDLWDEAFSAYIWERDGNRELTWQQNYAPPPDNEDPTDWAEAEAEYLRNLDVAR